MFKAQKYLCLAIFEKLMIQVHGKIILSIEFKSKIKAHDLNSWQFIYPKPNSHWQHQNPIFIGNIKTHWPYQSPILIGNIKAQFSLAIFKTQFSLAISKTQLMLALLKAQANYLALLYQKSPRLLTLRKKKIYHGIIAAQILLWQSSYKNSFGVILEIMISCDKPMKCMITIFITSTLMVSIQTHKAQHLHYDAVIRNHEHYLHYGIHGERFTKAFWSLSYCFKYYN